MRSTRDQARMARARTKDKDPPFRYMIQSNGQSEIWSHTDDSNKMKEYGWQCGNNKDAYELRTLMGNWFEERSDLKWLKIPEPFPSQFEHYFNSIYNSSYNTVPKSTVPEVLKNLHGHHPHAHPHHQPELDTETLKAIYNSWRTTYRSEYIDPRFRYRPIPFPSHPIPFSELPRMSRGQPISTQVQPISAEAQPILAQAQPNVEDVATADNQKQVPAHGQAQKPQSPLTWMHPPVREQPNSYWNRPNTVREEWMHPSFRQEPVDFWSRYNPSKTRPDLFRGLPYASKTILPGRKVSRLQGGVTETGRYG